MIIKAIFDHEKDFDYIYCPENMSISKSEIKQLFYNWVDNTDNEHPFWVYEDGIKGLCYRGDAIVYWLNNYIINDKENREDAKLLDSFSSEKLEYDLEIRL